MGGVSGLSAAYHLNQKYPSANIIIYEKTNDWGGLCGGFYVDSPQGQFWFDNAVHLSFTTDSYVQEVFHASSKPLRHTPDPTNFYQNFWVKHPAQNNLYALPTAMKVKVIKDMLQNPHKSENLTNFEQWLKAQYGAFFTEHFSNLYTRKYWTLESRDLSTNPVFVGTRFYIPDIEEVLFGAMSEDTPITYYAKEMRYPESGQYRSFFKSLTTHIHIAYHKEIIQINPESQEITCKDGSTTHYDKLISTLPLPFMANIITNAPQSVKQSASNLHATSVAIVSFGFNKSDIAKNLWFYVYDEDKLFARVYSPSRKSPNNAPKGCSSLQAEIYFSNLKPLETMIEHQGDMSSFLIAHTKQKFARMGICKDEDIICEDCRILPFGNVIFTHGMEKHRQIVLDFLASQGIISCGRFGEWDYLWSDQSFLSGKRAAENL